MDAAAQALGAQPAGPAIGVVARVRLLASRVAADAAAGERTLSSVIAEREEVRGGAVPVPMEVSTASASASASASPTRTPAATSSRAGGGALVGA